MTIRTLRFTPTAQRAFAKLSGDFNPLHLDATAARRSAAGEPVVHGMHLLLRSLDAYFSRIRTTGECVISARFSRPALLRDNVDVNANADGHLTLTLDDGVQLADVAISPSAADTDEAWMPSRSPLRRPTQKPRLISFEEAANAHGTTPLPGLNDVQRAFPRAVRQLGAHAVAAMSAVSRIVGMECPGRDSLLGAVDLAVRRRAADRVSWRVVKTDARFRLIRLEVQCECLHGTVDAFMTAPPRSQTVANVSARVEPAEFAGQRALIVGGSRGLGAATALIVASGGGLPLVTFATGRADIGALARDAGRSGRRIASLRFDLLKDPIARLVTASRRFRPTHLYYFASPKIFVRRREPFDSEAFERFAAFYVRGFADVCTALADTSPLAAFYPSSTALDERRLELTEYAAAKAAGEAVCGFLQEARPSLRILVKRLPRIATDQTASPVPMRAMDPVDAMLPIVRELHAFPRGQE